ncbi:Poly(ADP-ribose) glycohydrolase [Eumeta japonica]|uniref:poly(ADP-ribose) glycohydrolase n=1 Tax=Eumeta variegata TaxID=151549 RepID=A0A4C1X952_EUMVA|nr:Poly(ADP-ribose) glycohydrolase [Eumeta japonica]
MFDEEHSWVGVSLSELYGSQCPWDAPQFPVIKPAYNHEVLFHVSDDGYNEINNQPPKPQSGVDKWDQDYVRMPCSSHSLHPVVEGDTTNLKKRWEIIQNALEKPMKNSQDLEDAILSYNTEFKSIWEFSALHKLFNEYLEEEESKSFFSVTLPAITKLALALPRLVQSPIPLLRLYQSGRSKAVLGKLKCICHYFRKVCMKVPVGVMTFMRVSIPLQDCPEWASSNKLIGGTPLHVDSKKKIEDGTGLIQMNFANRYLGGGVLRRGCVQEEIRMVICPELMVSMLFTEVLAPTEALLTIGCERYSIYSGYSSTFEWAGDYDDTTPYDSSGRRRCAVLAIDATPFRKPEDQYKPEAILRELNKASVSACTSTFEARLSYPGVATGNWGCGAYRGSPHLKSLLQIMACTEARRPIAYYTFDDTKLRNDIINIYKLLSKHNVTVGQLYELILKFNETDVPRSQLYAFIRQALRNEEKSTPSKFEGHVYMGLQGVPGLFSCMEDTPMGSEVFIIESGAGFVIESGTSVKLVAKYGLEKHRAESPL